MGQAHNENVLGLWLVSFLLKSLFILRTLTWSKFDNVALMESKKNTILGYYKYYGYC